MTVIRAPHGRDIVQTQKRHVGIANWLAEKNKELGLAPSIKKKAIHEHLRQGSTNCVRRIAHVEDLRLDQPFLSGSAQDQVTRVHCRINLEVEAATPRAEVPR